VSGPEPRPRPDREQSRITKDSFLYGKAVPIVLGALGLITALMIVFALGVLVGWIPFR
jgi:ABC-type antimicrobial peptide transport system permease subunit